MIALCGAASLASGQGLVIFRTYVPSSTPPIDAPISDANGTLLSGANPNYRVALVGGPATTGDPWGLTHRGNLPLMFNPTDPTISWVNFGTGTTPPDAPGYANTANRNVRVVLGADEGQLALVQVVAWDGPQTTWVQAWQDAQSGSTRIGVSGVLRLTMLGPEQYYAYLWGLQSFQIDFVPEPTMFALAGLAGVELLISRRRK